MATVIQRARIRTAIATAILGVVMFGAAGSVKWPAGWLYFAVLVLATTLPLCGPLRFDQGLIEERLSSGPGAKKWDRLFVALVGVLTPAELVVPGLDFRFGWTPALPAWIMWAGFAGVVLGTAGLTWAMWTNRFFSAVIRIQRERGHTVITSGPYRVVRHPGYATWMVQTLSAPFLFRSLWTMVPVGLLVVMFFVRTSLEDRVLMDELDGYREYAARVTWKLIPGVW